MVCKKCLQPINSTTDVFTVCEGICMQAFHGACVGLSDDSVRCIRKNIIWLCDDCLADFHDHQQKKYTAQPDDNAPQKIYEELVDMKSKIANMEKTLSTMCAQPRDSISSMPSVPRHSTPIRSTKLYDGSKINASRSIQENSFQHASNSDSPIHHSEEMFSLFLTNIDGRVTEDEINVLVSESCGLKENRTFRIKKLVPKWKIDEPPDYASFKVTVEGKYKRLLLREDAWPIGIKYREFIERPRNIWKPCRF